MSSRSRCAVRSLTRAHLASRRPTGKPFCVLLPSSVVFSRLFREALAPGDVQLILPRRVRVRKANAPPVAFKFMAWVCYRMRLPRDLYLVGE